MSLGVKRIIICQQLENHKNDRLAYIECSIYISLLNKLINEVTWKVYKTLLGQPGRIKKDSATESSQIWEASLFPQLETDSLLPSRETGQPYLGKCSTFSGSTNGDQWEPQWHQINQADQITIKALKIKTIESKVHKSKSRPVCLPWLPAKIKYLNRTLGLLT